LILVDIHERPDDEDSVEDLVQGLSVSLEKPETRPKKYCRMMSMTLSEMTEIVVSSPEIFKQQLMENVTVSGEKVQREGGKVQYSVTQRKRGRTGLDVTSLSGCEDPLKRMGMYRICDIECSVSGEEIDSQGEDMYDLYIQRDGDHDGSDEGQVIYLRNDDFFIPEECYDDTDSFDDTEDSNAEDYYGNDYPDEDIWDSDPEDVGFVDLDRHLEEKFGSFYDDSSEYGSSDDYH
jgi:hypothetical protein